jgi:hypothetical protein
MAGLMALKFASFWFLWSRKLEKMHRKARCPQCELFGARWSERLNSEHPL